MAISLVLLALDRGPESTTAASGSSDRHVPMDVGEAGAAEPTARDRAAAGAAETRASAEAEPGGRLT
jgi:hypothetical protein